MYHPSRLVGSERQEYSKVQQVTLTPISNSQTLFLTSIEHGSDNQKTWSDRPFAYSKDQTNYKKACKVFAGGMAAHCDAPDSNVKAGNMMNHPPNAPCKIKANLIHFATGKRCKHRFCGYSKTRKPRKNMVPSLFDVCEEHHDGTWGNTHQLNLCGFIGWYVATE